MTRPLIVDPAAIPVVGTDHHLPALAPATLTPQALRQRFRSPSRGHAEIAGDGLSSGNPAPASVLVALVSRADGLHVLLTRRTDHLRDHAGQVSFPGGRAEAGDADVVDTALREAEEEVGLERARVEVIGTLPVYTTVTNFVVTPVVGLVLPPFALKLDSVEVAEAFEVPLAFLMTPAHHQRHQVQFDGRSRQFISMPWDGRDADGVQRRYFIWGATAAMLRNLYAFLGS